MLKTLVPVLIVLGAVSVEAQVTAPSQTAPSAAASAARIAPGLASPVAAPPDYLIGPDDVLGIVFWRDKDMSAEVAVRPDGKISLPLLNDVQAAGLTPPQLRERLVDEAKRFIEDPNVTVIVKQINSRRVFVTGEVIKPGPYPLIGATTVLQILATAGGLREYADAKHILVMRTENGRPKTYQFNYSDVSKRKSLTQNVELKPGDTIVVP